MTAPLALGLALAPGRPSSIEPLAAKALEAALGSARARHDLALWAYAGHRCALSTGAVDHWVLDRGLATSEPAVFRNRACASAFARGCAAVLLVDVDWIAHPHAVAMLLDRSRTEESWGMIDARAFPGVAEPAVDDETQSVAWCHARFTLVSARAWAVAGPFDPAFRRRCFGADFSWRVAAAGLSLLSCPGALVRPPSLSEPIPPDERALVDADFVRLAARWHTQRDAGAGAARYFAEQPSWCTP